MKQFSHVFLLLLLFIPIRSIAQSDSVITLKSQGAFSAGSSVIKSDGAFSPLKPWYETQGGQTRHGDHADVFYQIPVNTRKFPIIFLHGYGQSKRTWQTTADGREGFANLFLKRGFSTYLIDQPGRGDAGQINTSGQISAIPEDQTWFTQFRIGLYPNYNKGVQFPKDSTSLDNFFRMMTPNTGNISDDIVTDAMSAVFDKTGDCIFFTHSASGTIGWKTAIKNPHVKAIVAFEPGSFIFPEGEEPANNRGGKGIPMNDFMKLTKIPIVVYFGDFIPQDDRKEPSLIFWKNVLETANNWAKVVNAHGGDVTIVHLPDIGIHGNTHFIMSDLNNKEIANIVYKWLNEKKLAQ